MKTKGFDFKSFAIAHGEKVVLGIAGVLALFALVKTPWKTYTKLHPSVLDADAKKARETIAASQWPKDEQAKFTSQDVMGIKVRSMLMPIPGDKLITSGGKPGLAFDLRSSFSLYPDEKKLKVPEYFAVQDLEATFFRLVIAKKSTQLVVNTGEPDGMGGIDPFGNVVLPKTKAGDYKVPSTRRGGGMGMGGAAEGPAGHSGPMAMMKKQKGKKGKKSKGKQSAKGGHGGPAASGMGETPMTPGRFPGGGADGPGQLVEPDGRRAVSVRGIFPIRLQFEKYAKALNLPDQLDPLQQVDIRDFVLERRVSRDRGKTFSAWAAVDKKANVEYLKTEVADFEPDIVAQGVTHYIVTSPLPMRLLKAWGDEATHPALKKGNYLLTEEGRKRQELINQAVKEAKALQTQAEKESTGGGFGALQYNMNRARSDVMGNSAMQQRFTSYISKQLGPMGMDGDVNADRRALDSYKNEATAAGDLVLFRYFDFDVLPGMTYQYRVRLKLRNELFGKSTDRLDPSAKNANNNELVQTPVSNATKPVTVPPDTVLFVNDVNDQVFALAARAGPHRHAAGLRLETRTGNGREGQNPRHRTRPEYRGRRPPHGAAQSGQGRIAHQRQIGIHHREGVARPAGRASASRRPAHEGTRPAELAEGPPRVGRSGGLRR